MNIQVTWSRLQPDTKNGEKIVLKAIYSSFDEAEIDYLQKEFEGVYGSGIAATVETVDKEVGAQDD